MLEQVGIEQFLTQARGLITNHLRETDEVTKAALDEAAAAVDTALGSIPER